VIDDNDVLVPMSQVPRYLPISLQYAYDLVKKRSLPSVKIGGKLLIREAVLLKIKECGTVQHESINPAKELV
jgi:excisionase family DNA binding protein